MTESVGIRGIIFFWGVNEESPEGDHRSDAWKVKRSEPPGATRRCSRQKGQRGKEGGTGRVFVLPQADPQKPSP